MQPPGFGVPVPGPLDRRGRPVPAIILSRLAATPAADDDQPAGNVGLLDEFGLVWSRRGCRLGGRNRLRLLVGYRPSPCSARPANSEASCVHCLYDHGRSRARSRRAKGGLESAQLPRLGAAETAPRSYRLSIANSLLGACYSVGVRS